MKILELTFEDLIAKLNQDYGKGKYHATGIYREVFKKGKFEFADCVEFVKSQKLYIKIKNDLCFTIGKIIEKKEQGGVIKFITRLFDNNLIESVIIPMLYHNTLCVSSQVGCKMGCLFCQTGKMGFIRNLSVEEIVAQVYTAKFFLGYNIQNIVFMGMGEPFDNFDNVIQAIKVINDQKGLDIALSHITISTAGLVQGLNKLSLLNWPNLRVAISLNAPNNAKRSMLMPINRKIDMDELKQALLQYPLKKSGSFLIEYVLIKDVNDSIKDAKELGQYLRNLNVRLNLIPYNPHSGSKWQAPIDSDVHKFGDLLTNEGVFVRKRWSKGAKLAAGCGQLGKDCQRLSQINESI